MPHQPIIIPYDQTQDSAEIARIRKTRFIGGSEVSALFEQISTENPIEDPDAGLVEYEQDGHPVSPYATPFSLWALKTGRIRMSAKQETARTRWGRRQEAMIAQHIAEQENWTLRKPPGYFLHPSIPRMGAHLDYEVDDGTNGGEFVPLEIKMVSDMERSKWRNAVADLIVPMHIQLQVQHELCVTAKPYAHLGVLFGGYDLRIFRIERDDTMILDLEQAVTEFWAAVDANVEFEPNPERDTWVLQRLYLQVEPNSIVDWTDNTEMRQKISEYKELGQQENEIKKQREALRMMIMRELGTKEAADLGDGLLKASFIPAQSYTVNREPYRSMRIQKRPSAHAGRPLTRKVQR